MHFSTQKLKKIHILLRTARIAQDLKLTKTSLLKCDYDVIRIVSIKSNNQANIFFIKLICFVNHSKVTFNIPSCPKIEQLNFKY